MRTAIRCACLVPVSQVVANYLTELRGLPARYCFDTSSAARLIALALASIARLSKPERRQSQSY